MALSPRSYTDQERADLAAYGNFLTAGTGGLLGMNQGVPPEILDSRNYLIGMNAAAGNPVLYFGGGWGARDGENQGSLGQFFPTPQSAPMSFEQFMALRGPAGTTQPPAAPQTPRFGNNLAQYLPNAGTPGATPTPFGYSGNLQSVGVGTPFGANPPNFGFNQPALQGGGWPMPQPGGMPQTGFGPLPMMQGTNPFGAMGLQAYQQQLGGQAGQPQPQQPPPQATAQAPDRYEQRFIDRMLKMMNPAAGTGGNERQQAALDSLAKGVIPDFMKQNPLYQRMVTDKRENAQARAAEQAAMPWFLKPEDPAQMQGMSPEQRKQYGQARQKAAFDYYRQNPSQITDAMTKQAGGMGDIYALMRGDMSSIDQKAQQAMQAQAGVNAFMDPLRAKLQDGTYKVSPSFARGFVPGAAGNLGMQDAYMLHLYNLRNQNLQRQGQPQLPGLVSMDWQDYFQQGPQTQGQAQQYFANQAIGQAARRFGR